MSLIPLKGEVACRKTIKSFGFRLRLEIACLIALSEDASSLANSSGLKTVSAPYSLATEIISGLSLETISLSIY